MVCVCKDALAGLIPRLSPLAGLNAGISPSLAAGLGGAASLAAGAALSPNVALAANLGLKVDVAAMANLSALATFCGNMQNVFGINMASPGALPQLNQLASSLSSAALNNTLAQLPLGATPQLSALADLGSAANLGVNPLSANALGQLNALADLGGDLAGSLGASLGMSPSLALGLSTQLNAMLAAQAALSGGLGLNLPALGLPGLGAFGASLGTIGSNIAALNTMLPPLALNLALLTKVKAFLDKLNAANKSLDLDLSLPSKWPNIASALNASAAKSADWSPSLTAAPSAGANLAASKALFESPAFSALTIPTVPPLMDLLAGLFASLFSATGTNAVQQSPCGPLCLLMAALPPGCLCPKMAAEVARKPAFKFNFKPTASFTPSVSGSVTDPKDMLKVSATKPEDMLRTSSSGSTSATSHTKTHTHAKASGNVHATKPTLSGGPIDGVGGRRLSGLRLGVIGRPSAADQKKASRQRDLENFVAGVVPGMRPAQAPPSSTPQSAVGAPRDQANEQRKTAPLPLPRFGRLRGHRAAPSETTSLETASSTNTGTPRKSKRRIGWRRKAKKR